ncbi:hypothetical protein BV210_05975 [Halorientalis sp. IM1011]|uniref:hypothetical protein n=1 Tax=Halorientalis sp. IM1011 TaxID=1932360 RepID=UPI00097CC94F|nr:hypothetical protein [Halorientalis sp. IM1011]AQL42288.1 hypothetical protein BV210_05975 [Halorientalis sp. IM1011]
MLAILAVGLYTRNVGIVVNAAIAFATTLVPAIIERDLRIELDARFTLWITLALFLHTLGLLGFYGEVWWYDRLTHTLSAAVVATVGYVVARAIDDHSTAVVLTDRFLFVYVLVFTLGLGVLWEILEFGTALGARLLGFEPILTQYGLTDTLGDLLFDTVGAVVAATVATERVSSVVASLRRGLDRHDADDDTPLRSIAHERPDVDSLDAVVRYERANARRSWVVVGFLALVTVGAVAAGAILFAAPVAVVVALALVPTVAYRDRRATLPWQLLVLPALPVFGGVAAQPWLAATPLIYVAVAAVALTVAVELHLFTAVRMTPTFAVLFVVVATMAAAGLWAVGRWLVDLTLGTHLLLDPTLTSDEIETRLMWEFVYAAAAGLFAGALFEWRFRRS